MSTSPTTHNSLSRLKPEPCQLGVIIRHLLKLRGLRAFDLSERIGITPTSLSKIINGSTRPRQTTFTKLCQSLCETEEEKNELVNAYAKTELQTKEEDPAPYGSSPEAQAQRDADKEINRLRAEQFIERKTQSIQFKRSVARELDKADIPYIRDYCEGIISTDFLIHPNGKRIALECKANVGRDMEKTEAMCEVIGESLGCEAIVVVPYAEGTETQGMSKNLSVSSLSDLKERLHRLNKTAPKAPETPSPAPDDA